MCSDDISNKFIALYRNIESVIYVLLLTAWRSKRIFIIMFFIKICFITLFFVYQVKSLPQAKGEKTLELVHVFFRHGDRTPDKKDFYSTDPYKNHSFYPYGLGQLTNDGKLREFHLGELLRKKYNDFLGDVYLPNSIYGRSSDFSRTKMSLQLVLAGLWPPSSMQQWNPSLLWQPIPYDFKTATEDHLIQRPNHYCPKYLEELEKVILSPEVQSYIEKNKETFEYVEKWTGKEMIRPINMFDVYQNLNAEDSLKLELPEWTKKVYPEPLHSIAAMQTKFENYNDILIRLNGGNSLKYVIENMKKKIKNDKDMFGRKMILLSGHENNVLNVLTTLDKFEPHVPIYGSAVIFELHKIDAEKYAIKVLHHDQKSDEPKVLQLNDCPEMCPFDKFISLTSRYVPGNYTAECNSDVNLD